MREKQRKRFKPFGAIVIELVKSKSSRAVWIKESERQLYTAAALMTSPRAAASSGEYGEHSTITSFKVFVTSLAGHVAAEAARLA